MTRVCHDAESRRKAEDLAAAIAALPVVESNSPIRSWQLDGPQEEGDDNRELVMSVAPWAEFGLE
jgi:hypothetical protein